MKMKMVVVLAAIVVGLVFITGLTFAADKPNIVIIWGDDIGQSSISAPTTQGLMGYKTPEHRSCRQGRCDVHRLVRQQSCTAGRAAFITGQSPIRTGLTKVGLPGAPVGLKKEDADDCRAAQSARLRHRPVW